MIFYPILLIYNCYNTIPGYKMLQMLDRIKCLTLSDINQFNEYNSVVLIDMLIVSITNGIASAGQR